VRASQQLQYAIYGIFDLAYNGGSRPIRVQEISVRQHIPTRYLEQIFQKLRRAGLVASKRGPGGGYSLARSPEEITLADVLLAVQGELLTRSDGGLRPVRESPGFVWDLVRDGLADTLGRWNVADLCREAARRGVDRAESEPAMYHI
jgi:Rrf2 family iron-sulfur cluster assembly transcriptional regulator